MTDNMTRVFGAGRHLVFTVITGNYDALGSSRWRPPNVDFVAFVDEAYRGPKPKPWEVRIISSEQEPALQNRTMKILPPAFQESYDTITYIDGNIEIIGPLEQQIASLIESSHSIAMFAHFSRDNPEDEIYACLTQGKLSAEHAEFELSRLRTGRYKSLDLRLVDGGVVIRDMSKPRVLRIMTEWFDLFMENPVRDQISLSLTVAQFREDFLILPHWKNGVSASLIRKPHRSGASILVAIFFRFGLYFPALLWRIEKLKFHRIGAERPDAAR